MKFIRNIVIYTLFFILSMCIALFFTDISPTVLSSDHSVKVSSAQSVYSFKFRSTEDNLGIIFVPLVTSNAFYPLQTMFSISDKNTGTPIYSGQYNIKFLSANYIFPFGFPTMENSKNKEYFVKIYQINTQKSTFSMADKVEIVSKYSFGKKTLLTNHKLFLNFLHHKLAYEVIKAEFWLKTFFFLAPLIMIAWISIYPLIKPLLSSLNLPSNIIGRYINPVTFSFIFLIYFEVVFMDKISNFYFIFIAIFWLTLHYILDFKIHTLIIALILIFFTFLLQSAGFFPYALKSSIWIYIFLILGLVQEGIDNNVDKLNILAPHKKAAIARLLSYKYVKEFVQIYKNILKLVKIVIRNIPKLKELSPVVIYMIIFLLMIFLSQLYKLW